jgi:hypothetical protein
MSFSLAPTVPGVSAKGLKTTTSAARPTVAATCAVNSVGAYVSVSSMTLVEIQKILYASRGSSNHQHSGRNFSKIHA